MRHDDRLLQSRQIIAMQRAMSGLPMRYKPYIRQREFHNAGDSFRHRLFQAGNRVGKTHAAMVELYFHLTGMYPVWWEGLRYTSPPRLLVVGVSFRVLRETTIKELFGHPGSLRKGEGYEGIVGMDMVNGYQYSSQSPGVLDWVTLSHISGGSSRVVFMSYEQKRDEFQGFAVDGVYFDEEPPADIYDEAATRSSTGEHGKRTTLTLTPLKGETEITRRFRREEERLSASRHVTRMSLHDVPHFTAAEKAEYEADYDERTREARVHGNVVLGDGAVFPVGASKIRRRPLGEISEHWKWIAAVDFGWTHKQACVLCYYEPKADIIHVERCWSEKRKSAPEARLQVMRWGDPLWAWPHDGNRGERLSQEGPSLVQVYRDAGFRMMRKHVKNPDGGRSRVWGVQEMLVRMQSGRLKVNSELVDWFDEYDSYHYDGIDIVTRHDDLMSATRYAVMAIVGGWAEPVGSAREAPRQARRVAQMRNHGWLMR